MAVHMHSNQFFKNLIRKMDRASSFRYPKSNNIETSIRTKASQKVEHCIFMKFSSSWSTQAMAVSGDFRQYLVI